MSARKSEKWQWLEETTSTQVIEDSFMLRKRHSKCRKKVVAVREPTCFLKIGNEREDGGVQLKCSRWSVVTKRDLLEHFVQCDDVGVR